jgi:hypothetical protein
MRAPAQLAGRIAGDGLAAPARMTMPAVLDGKLGSGFGHLFEASPSSETAMAS